MSCRSDSAVNVVSENDELHNRICSWHNEDTVMLEMKSDLPFYWAEADFLSFFF